MSIQLYVIGKVRYKINKIKYIILNRHCTLFLFSNLSLTVDLTYDHNGRIILFNHYAYDSVCIVYILSKGENARTITNLSLDEILSERTLVWSDSRTTDAQ